MFKEGLVTTAYGVIPYGITVGEQEFRAANPEPYADEDTSPDTIKALFEGGYGRGPAWQALPLT